MVEKGVGHFIGEFRQGRVIAVIQDRGSSLSDNRHGTGETPLTIAMPATK